MKSELVVTSLIFFIVRAFFSLFNFTDIVSLILSFVVGLILVFISFAWKDRYQNKFLKFIYTGILLFLVSFILLHTTNFINSNFFQADNKILILISLVLLGLFIGKNKISTIASVGNILMFFFFLIFLILMVGIVPEVRLQNFSLHLSFAFLPFAFVFITGYFHERKKDIIKGYILAFITTLIEVTLSTLSYGYLLSSTYLYTEVSVLRKLSFFSFLGNFEIIFSLIYLFEGTITLAVIIHIIKTMYQKKKS